MRYLHKTRRVCHFEYTGKRLSDRRRLSQPTNKEQKSKSQSCLHEDSLFFSNKQTLTISYRTLTSISKKEYTGKRLSNRRRLSQSTNKEQKSKSRSCLHDDSFEVAAISGETVNFIPSHGGAFTWRTHWACPGVSGHVRGKRVKTEVIKTTVFRARVHFALAAIG